MLNRFSENRDFLIDEEEYRALTSDRHSRRFGTADLHIHSGAGDGMASIESTLEYVQYRTSLNLIAITDHDIVEGALQAREIASRKGYDFSVIVGSEITSMHGHVLALFIEKPVRSLQTLEKTISDVHEQGGVCVIPHPLSWLTRSVGRRTLEKVLGQGIRVDGLETCNASIAGIVRKEKVLQLNSEIYHLAETGGSDAHFLPHIGSGYTIFQGKTSDELLGSLLNSNTKGIMDKSVIRDKVTLRQFAAQQVRSLLVLPARQAKKTLKSLLKEA